MKRILILLSTYNGEKYISEQIDSLLKQKNVEIHVLIRDDGSNDNTVEVLRSIKDNRISFISGNNLGACKSFFSLLREASLDYDYYALCDQDDVWLSDKLKVAVDHLDGFDVDKPSLYYSGQILTDKELNIVSEHKLDTKKSVYANWIFNQMAGCTAVFNRKLLEILKMHIPNNIKYHDVWCYKVCAAFNGNIYVDRNGRILYRQHGNNVVGMNTGIKGKIERAKRYIFLYNCSSFANELLEGYKDYLSKDWLKFLNNIVMSNKKISSRINLLKNKSIKFNSASLRCLFIVKVLIKKI